MFLEGTLAVVQQRLKDAGAGAEAAEHRPLADPGPLSEGVHGDPVRAEFGEHLDGYVIVNSKRQEIDFEDSAGNNVPTTYTGMPMCR